MVAVIPFVGKVLDACKDSKVFKPSNPWVATIMSLLAEIHGLEKVKLNITFEIEIICQNMGLKVTDLKPSSELKGRKVKHCGLHPEVICCCLALCSAVVPGPSNGSVQTLGIFAA